MLLLHQKLVENRKNQEQQNKEKNLFTFLDDYGSPVKGQTYTLSTFDDITQALAYKILSSKEQGGYGISKSELVSNNCFFIQICMINWIMTKDKLLDSIW